MRKSRKLLFVESESVTFLGKYGNLVLLKSKPFTLRNLENAILWACT